MTLEEAPKARREERLRLALGFVLGCIILTCLEDLEYNSTARRRARRSPICGVMEIVQLYLPSVRGGIVSDALLNLVA